jgi:hypothetical protein
MSCTCHFERMTNEEPRSCFGPSRAQNYNRVLLMSTGVWLESAETLRERSASTKVGGATPGRGRRNKERRDSLRLPLAIPIFARGVDERGKEFLEFTTTLNVSASGVLLAMRRSALPDSEVLIEIPAAPLPKVAAPPEFVRSLQARVVRVAFGEPSYLWALRFNRPLQ